MVRSEVVDVHGIHEVEGPLLVGGVEYLASRIGLFTEQLVLEHLRTDQAFRDYLEFREEVFRKAVREMISTFKSPVDLFFLTDLDRVDFQRQSFNHRTLIQQYNMIVDEESNRSGAVKMSENGVLDEDRIFNKSRKDHISTKLSKARRYYAYRKSLLKLDFIQGNSDPDLVLKLIKKSARWRLDDFELKRGLESHMDLLKEYTSRFGSGCSLSDYENAALERINSEMGSEVEEILYYPNPDEWLMNGYFNRMKLKSLTRDCCLLAENSDITLVKEFMPVPVKEHRTLPSLKQAMKLSVKDWTNNLRGEGAVRGKKNGSQCDMKKEELEWQHHQGERVSQRMPHLLREMKNLTKKMRPHFQDDPVGLKLWDNHAKEILYGFEYNLPTALASPTNLPTTVRYQNIMKKKARFMTSGGVDKRLVAAGGVVAVAGVALGLVFRPTSGKQQEAE